MTIIVIIITIIIIMIIIITITIITITIIIIVIIRRPPAPEGLLVSLDDHSLLPVSRCPLFTALIVPYHCLYFLCKKRL